MFREHLTSSDLMAAAESGKPDAAAREHAESCSRCRARLESALAVYAAVGRTLGTPPGAASPSAPDFLRAHEVSLSACLAESDDRSSHPDEDALLALLTEALPPDAATELRAHLEGCPACARRADTLRHEARVGREQHLSDRYREETKAAARSSLPGRTRVVARLVEGLRELVLTVIPPPHAGLAFDGDFMLSADEAPRRQLARPSLGKLMGRLGRSLPASKARKADVFQSAWPATPSPSWAPGSRSVHLDAHGHTVRLRGSATPAPRLDVETRAGLLVELRTAAGKTYSARTGEDGRATFPLEPGAAILRLGTTPRWEIEIVLETL